LRIPKNDGAADYDPSPGEIDEAIVVRKAIRKLFRHGDSNKLDHLERKSLTSFSFGSSGFFLAPEQSDQVLSCLADQTDIAGLMNNVQISGGSIKFPIDNVDMADAAWACQSECWGKQSASATARGPWRVGNQGGVAALHRLRRFRLDSGFQLQY
jgi:HK97 family phage major capsid protein